MTTDIDVDFLSLAGPDNETIVTELSPVGVGVLQTYHFKRRPRYYVPSNDSSPPSTSENICDEGHIPYSHLSTILRDAVGGYVHLYCHGEIKCTLLSGLSKRTFIDRMEFKCPEPHELNKAEYSCDCLATDSRL